MPLGLLDLNEDVLRAIGEAAALAHPPHWEFPRPGKVHEWEPPGLSRAQAATNEDFFPDKRFCLGWIYLSHVSRRLRTIINDCPALWAKIALALPSRRSLEVLLSRAQQMPLQLHVPSESWRANSDRRRYAQAKSISVGELIQRAGIIDIREDIGYPLDIHFLTRALATLRHLVIARNYYGRDRMVINASNLVSLTLHGTLPVFSSSLPSLRELDIKGPPRFDSRPRDALILYALSRTPALEKFKLVYEHAIEFAIGNSTQTLALPIQLPYLRLASITLPRANLDITTENPWSYIEAPDNTNVILRYIRPMSDWTSVLTPMARQLRLPVYNRVTFLFSGSTITVGVDDNTNEEPGIRLEKHRRPTCDDVLRLLPAYIPVFSIQYLHIALKRSNKLVHDGIALHEFLAVLSRVSVLDIETDEKTSEKMYLILADSTSTRNDLPAALPFLHTLVVRRAWVPKPHEKRPNILTAPWAGVILFIQSRADAGGRLPCLKLSGDWRRHQLSDKEREAARFADERMKSAVAPYVDNVVDQRINR